MQKLLEILFTIIKTIVITIVFCIEVSMKIGAITLFIAIFIVAAFFAPLTNKIYFPKWWESFANYCVHPLYFPLVEWIKGHYDY